MPFLYLNPRVEALEDPRPLYTYVTPMTGACKMVNYDARDDIIGPAREAYGATRASFVKTTDPLWLRTVLPNVYFGCAYSPDMPSPPSPVSFPIPFERVKGGMKRQEFLRLCREGEIVVQPYRVVSGTVTCRPGVVKQNLTSPSVKYMSNDLKGLYPTTQSSDACGGNPGKERMLYSGNLAAAYDAFPAFLKMSVMYDLYFIPPAVNPWGLPAQTAANAAVRDILSRLDTEPMNDGLITSTLANANSGAWDILTEMAEAKETISWIMATLSECLSLWSATRRDVRNLRKVPSAVAERWLEFRYAVTPLVSSVQTALLASSYLNAMFKTYRQGAQGELEIDSSGWKGKVTYIDRCFIKRRLETSSFMRNSQYFQANGLVTAWELVPLSFIIDWVLNVGDLLTAISPPSGVVKQGATYSRAVRAPIQLVNDKFPGAAVSIDLRYYTQEPINPLAHVGLNLDINMTWKRWLDALALSWTMSKKSLLKGA